MFVDFATLTARPSGSSNSEPLTFCHNISIRVICIGVEVAHGAIGAIGAIGRLVDAETAVGRNSPRHATVLSVVQGITVMFGAEKKECREKG
jgi:hypothetical protein